MYNSLIHSNDTLCNIEKFNYLLSSATGPPLTLLKCTPLTSDNYVVAYNALKSRYENKRLISTSHWHAIEQTKRLSSCNNPALLRQFLDTFSENISISENLGFPTAQWDFVLFNVLLIV